MAKYRVEAKLINLKDGRKWGPHVIEFDTETTPRGIVRDRFQSIYNVVLRMIRKSEDIPNPDHYPLTTRQFAECPDAQEKIPEEVGE